MKTYDLRAFESTTSRNTHYVVVLGTKKRFPDCYGFRSEELAKAWIAEQRQLDAKLEAERKARREAKKAVRRAIKNPYKVGDVLYNSWGYDQTNVDWYQVTRVSERSVWLRPISREYRESDWLAGHSKAKADHFIGEEFRKTLQVLEDGRVYVSMDHGWVSKWDGEKAVYESSYH